MVTALLDDPPEVYQVGNGLFCDFHYEIRELGFFLLVGVVVSKVYLSFGDQVLLFVQLVLSKHLITLGPNLWGRPVDFAKEVDCFLIGLI